MPLSTIDRGFEQSLATRARPLFLDSLTHHVHPMAPAGVVDGLAEATRPGLAEGAVRTLRRAGGAPSASRASRPWRRRRPRRSPPIPRRPCSGHRSPSIRRRPCSGRAVAGRDTSTTGPAGEPGDRRRRRATHAAALGGGAAARRAGPAPAPQPGDDQEQPPSTPDEIVERPLLSERAPLPTTTRRRQRADRRLGRHGNRIGAAERTGAAARRPVVAGHAAAGDAHRAAAAAIDGRTTVGTRRLGDDGRSTPATEVQRTTSSARPATPRLGAPVAPEQVLQRTIADGPTRDVVQAARSRPAADDGPAHVRGRDRVGHPIRSERHRTGPRRRTARRRDRDRHPRGDGRTVRARPSRAGATDDPERRAARAGRPANGLRHAGLGAAGGADVDRRPGAGGRARGPVDRRAADRHPGGTRPVRRGRRRPARRGRRAARRRPDADRPRRRGRRTGSGSRPRRWPSRSPSSRGRRPTSRHEPSRRSGRSTAACSAIARRRSPSTGPTRPDATGPTDPLGPRRVPPRTERTDSHRHRQPDQLAVTDAGGVARVDRAAGSGGCGAPSGSPAAAPSSPSRPPVLHFGPPPTSAPTLRTFEPEPDETAGHAAEVATYEMPAEPAAAGVRRRCRRRPTGRGRDDVDGGTRWPCRPPPRRRRPGPRRGRSEAEVLELARVLYPQLQRRLARDLLLDRERAGYRTDIRF